MYLLAAFTFAWTGSKTGRTGPVGIYARESGCDPLASLTVAG